MLHPVNAGKSCDPEGRYVRRWLPWLSACPVEYIHRPWEMPLGRWQQPIVVDLDEARRRHCRQVLLVRQRHPELVARNGHEWLRLPGRKGLLAKLVTRQEFRADTAAWRELEVGRDAKEDFIFYQGPGMAPKQLSDNQAVLSEEVSRHEL